MKWLFFILLILVGWCLSIDRSQYEPYGANVALRKPANQSSTYSENGFMYSASLGIDGVKSTTFSSNTCTHTSPEKKNAWWTVDLEGFYFIKFIRIYQMIESNRLDGSEMYVRLKNHIWQRIYFNSTSPPGVFNVSVNLDKPVCEIMLNNSKAKDAFVSICEFEAFEVIECLTYSIGNGSIKVVQHGDSNQSFTYGTNLSVTCHEGYRISEDGVVGNETESTLECKATAHWSRNLSCSVTVCGWPSNIPINSKMTIKPGIAGSNTYNATLTVECNEGYNYSLKEKEHIRCGSDGLWAGNLGNCYVIDCGQPLNIPDNSTIMYSTGLAGNTSYNATLTVKCNNGFNYTFPGNETIRCGEDGRWAGFLGICKVTRCTEIVPPQYGVIVVEAGAEGRWSFNTTVAVICNTGYSLSGEALVKCFETGRWTSALGHCLALQEMDKDQEQSKTYYLSWIILGPLCFILLISTIVTCIQLRRHSWFKRQKRSMWAFCQTFCIQRQHVPDDVTIAGKAVVTGHRLQAKKGISAYDFVEEFDMKNVKRKSNGSDNNAMELYDNLQKDNSTKSDYDKLKFERESSEKTTMKNEAYQNVGPQD